MIGYIVIHRPVEGMEQSVESFSLMTYKEQLEFRQMLFKYNAKHSKKIPFTEFTFKEVSEDKFEFLVETFGKTFGDFPDLFLALGG